MTKIFNSLEHMKPRSELRLVKFLLLSVLCLWLIGPVEAPAQVVDIPDANLRAAIVNALNKAPGDAITRADMETLQELRATGRNIADLRGIEFAINLTLLDLWRNDISGISPLSSLTNLTTLLLNSNDISDISPLSSLTNLTRLELFGNTISDISPLVSLTNLTSLELGSNKTLSQSDISPLASLINLTYLSLAYSNISDISAVASLTNLTYMRLQDNSISDISPLASLINLTGLILWRNTISDISPLSGLTNLTTLDLENNNISDISPLSGLINLTTLGLENNSISNIVPLIALTNLTFLDLRNNNISDIETLERLMAQGTIVHFSGNPAFETPGPKIEDGWVWLIVPTGAFTGGSAAASGQDFLSKASGGAVTEADVARNGARAGTRVGDSVWTAARLDATDPNNLNTIVSNYNLGTDIAIPVAYGVVPIQSETPQETRVYIGGAPAKVWLNGTLVYKASLQLFARDYETAVPILLMPGENLLFVAAYRPYPSAPSWGAFFGFQDGTVYTVGSPGAGSLDVNGDGQVNVLDLVLVAVFYGTRGNGLPADVNADGIVNVQDFAAVAAGVDAAGRLPQHMVEDLLQAAIEQVAALEAVPGTPVGFGTPPRAVLSAGVAYSNVAAALADVRALAGGDVRFGEWIPLLKVLLQVLAETREIPDTTALLPNYPNPFNPETWIPYHLATDADVILTIYDVRGSVVRGLTLGHQPAGVYESRGRAAYWDGRNAGGEPVASGVYFYTLTAGAFTATRKMLIRK